MKKPLEITLKELHVGACKTVTALQMNNDASLGDFLHDLILSNPKAMNRIQTAMATISSEPHYYNDTKFKSVSEKGIYEIKAGGIRLYCFQDTLSDDLPRLIIATNGGVKNTKKEQHRDILAASQIRERYLKAKKDDSTTLNYIPIEP